MESTLSRWFNYNKPKSSQYYIKIDNDNNRLHISNYTSPLENIPNDYKWKIFEDYYYIISPRFGYLASSINNDYPFFVSNNIFDNNPELYDYNDTNYLTYAINRINYRLTPSTFYESLHNKSIKIKSLNNNIYFCENSGNPINYTFINTTSNINDATSFPFTLNPINNSDKQIFHIKHNNVNLYLNFYPAQNNAVVLWPRVRPRWSTLENTLYR